MNPLNLQQLSMLSFMRMPQYGALLCTGIPQKLQVKDEQICDLPVEPAGWRVVAVSCFRHNALSVPIVDVPYIFSDALVKQRR
jgi:hypothetical protein